MPRKAHVHSAVGVEMHIVARYLRGAQGKTASWRVQCGGKCVCGVLKRDGGVLGPRDSVREPWRLSSRRKGSIARLIGAWRLRAYLPVAVVPVRAPRGAPYTVMDLV